jgi:hypothetical protein
MKFAIGETVVSRFGGDHGYRTRPVLDRRPTCGGWTMPRYLTMEKGTVWCPEWLLESPA